MLIIGSILILGVIGTIQNINRRLPSTSTQVLLTTTQSERNTVTINSPTITSTEQPTSSIGMPSNEASTSATMTETLSFSSGDLPEGWTAGKIFSDPPVDYTGPKPANVISHGLIEPGQRLQSGNIDLLTFETIQDAETAFRERVELIQRTVDKDVVFRRPQLGDQSFLAPGHGNLFILNKLVFIRCETVVEILLGTNDDTDIITNYAQRIDERLQSSSCQ